MYMQTSTLGKYIFRSVMLVVIVVISAMVVLLWLLAKDFAQPKPRALQDYHYQLLHQQQGISITHFACASGNAPCLFVLPSTTQTKQLNQQQKNLHQQLQQDFGHLPQTLTAATNDTAAPKAIVMLLHGRKGRKEDLLPVAARFAAVGYMSVLLDLPHHGDSPLPYSQFGLELQQNTLDIVNTSLADAQQWLVTQNPVVNRPTPPAFMWGMSMGGSYAIHAIAHHPQQWQGLIIVESFARLSAVTEAQADKLLAHLPIGITTAVKPLVTKTFATFAVWQGGVNPTHVQPAALAQQLKLPILVLHGDKDEVIDTSQGKQLYNSFASTDKTWLAVTNAGHHNILITDAPVYATMADWLLSHS